MALKTEETFQLQASADRVWSYLIDPRQVVQCLPGAELTSVQDESTFLGKVKVKVGPVVAAYTGKVVITERDDAARVVRMVGEGRESAGGGSAKVLITSTVAALPTGGSEVRVTADLDIVGKIAQFGRGMIESVNKQMFRQFTECVRATLETPAPAAPIAGLPVDEGARPVAGVVIPPPAAADATRVAPSAASPTYATARPVRLLPLLGRAIWESIAGLVRRLLGRRSDASR
ncbi:MAG TPA: SRPBCC family protein [Gemmatimonadaceae bacterium]|nr:SRPBCC family protein [Gemmatimonadaceae bacterium]